MSVSKTLLTSSPLERNEVRLKERALLNNIVNLIDDCFAIGNPIPALLRRRREQVG